MIEILATGPLATLQDAGRSGQAALGVARSGAFDRGAFDLANRLVGNSSGAAAIEVTLGGLWIRVHDAATLALTGAACPGLDVGTPVSVAGGTVIRLGVPPSGLRSYLAVRGGFANRAVLGSRSTDTLSGLGPAPLRAGDRLAVGTDHRRAVSSVPAPGRAAPPALRIVPGPREDWFAADAVARLLETPWSVRPDSDRIGVRLDGPPLPRANRGELPSEATRPGALQIPPHGRPILLGPDAPVTGGYPVLAVVIAADLDAAAQLRPGDPVRFALR